MQQNNAFIDIAKVSVLQTVLDLVPPKMARGLNVLPVSLDGNRLTLCVPDRTDFSVREKLERLLPDLELTLVEPREPDVFPKALREHYPDSVLKGELDQAENLFSYILKRALSRNASDIHLSPIEEGSRIRMRVDGKLQTDRTVTVLVAAELVSYIKVLAKLDISEKRAPQDGNIDIGVEGVEISLRVATVPTLYGEHVTLRLLSQTREALRLERLEDLGMHARQFEMFKYALGIPNGVVILSGPTGSGKTTTLYAALRELVKRDILHVVSIEDPVEKPVPGVTQIKVDSRQERVSFGKALRSVLRHDPDVVMVGEVRDAETATTALRSALTGHLVLTTLHTNSAPGILSRLTDLGVPTYLVAATLRLVVAQRLLRRPCRACMEWVEADEAVRRACGWHSDSPVRIPKTNGCAFCGMTGYSGRTAIYEMLPMTNDVRELLRLGKGEGELYNHLKKNAPSLTLRGDGLSKVLEGETTLEELDATVIDEDNALFSLVPDES
jgi:type II secretory ATPase GspE/PulE/Tfp pilus assembly ATPase PilB-like protein